MSQEIRYEPERLKALADAVFAIAMTLLVLELKVPELHGSDVGRELGRQLRAESGAYLAYALSFYVLGLIWLGHVRLFRRVEAADDWLVRANLVMLLLVGVLPFPTALLGRYGSQTWGVVPYACCMVLLELLLAVAWWRCARRGLLTADADQSEVRVALARYLSMAGVFAVSVPVAVVRPADAAYVWIVLAVVPWAAGMLAVRGRAAERVLESA